MGNLVNPFIFGGGAAPLIPMTGLAAWWKADALALSNNDPVASWTDSSVTGAHATQGTGGNRPLYKANILNGLPVVRFDGTDDWLSCGTVLGKPASYTSFVVMQKTSASTRRCAFGSCNNAEQAVTCWALFDSNLIGPAGCIFWQFGNESNGQYSYGYTEAASLVDATWACYTNRYTSGQTTQQWWRDGSPLTVTTSLANSNLLVGAHYAFSIGRAGESDTLYWDGDIAELIVYNVALSDVDRASVEAYLATKYGL